MEKKTQSQARRLAVAEKETNKRNEHKLPVDPDPGGGAWPLAPSRRRKGLGRADGSTAAQKRAQSSQRRWRRWCVDVVCGVR